MPVDLSRIGLEGIETGQRTLSAIAQRENWAVARESQQIENDLALQEQELGQVASQRMQQIADGTFKGEATLFKHDPEDASDAVPLEVLADTFMRGGAPKQGGEYLKAASEIRKREADINKGKIDAKRTAVETTLKTADLVSQTVGIAQNQSEWEWGLQQLEESEALPPDAIKQLKQMDYDPDVVTYLNEQALSAKDRASMDLSARIQDRVEEDTKFRQGNSSRLAKIAEQRVEIARKAAERVGKSGTDASAPNTNDVASAKSAIISQVFKGEAAPEDLGKNGAVAQGAYAIAARAKALVRTNKTLDWDTALNRAVAESQANGDWDTDKGMSIFGFALSDDKTKFDGSGKSPEAAIPLPPKGTPLKKGRYYITGKGKVMWDGSKGIPVE